MPDGSDALFGALFTAGVKRIGCHIDVVATVLILIGEPGHVPGLEHLLPPYDSLHGSCGILSAKQDGYGFLGSKTASKKARGDLTHCGSSYEWDHAGH